MRIKMLYDDRYSLNLPPHTEHMNSYVNGPEEPQAESQQT